MLKVAIVYDWLTNFGGGERLLLDVVEAFPEAPVYTSVYDREAMTQFKDVEVITSKLQKYPFKYRHQLYSTLRPAAFEAFDFSGYDVVLSIGSAESKGVITKPSTKHIAYLFTPTRYYWSNYHGYLKDTGFGPISPLVRLLLPRMARSMRQWDYAASQRPDQIFSISNAVSLRIEKYYRRSAEVIYPPLDLDRFHVGPKQDFYLVVSRLIPYKRTDLAIEACRLLGRKLIVVGDGSEIGRLKGMAGPETKFLGRLSDRQVAEYMSKARALIFPQEEDFGITALEAMASGTPVIAFGAGGVLETVQPGLSGTFFSHQTIESLKGAVGEFEKQTYDSEAIKRSVGRFDRRRFIDELRSRVG
jgi:glycosyltransferase involved in cell wall biosynthesis